MINKRKLVLLLLCLTICILALSACGVEERLMEHFPEWYELPVELSDLTVNLSIEMEFQGINFDAYTSPEGDTYDEVVVHLANTGEGIVNDEDAFALAYLYKDIWYSIYTYVPLPLGGVSDLDVPVLGRPDGHVGIAGGFSAHAQEDISFLVPSGLFDISGQYMLYYRSVGICHIDIVL